MYIFVTLETQKGVGRERQPPSSPRLHHSICYICQFHILISGLNNITKTFYNKTLNSFGLST